MKQATTADRLRQIMQERQMAQVDILRAAKPFCEKYDVKLGKGMLSLYVSGKAEPGQEKLAILGLALNVSEAWLMGFDVPMERKITPISDAIEDRRLIKIHELAEQLNPEEQDHIISQMEWLLSRK